MTETVDAFIPTATFSFTTDNKPAVTVAECPKDCPFLLRRDNTNTGIPNYDCMMTNPANIKQLREALTNALGLGLRLPVPQEYHNDDPRMTLACPGGFQVNPTLHMSGSTGQVLVR